MGTIVVESIEYTREESENGIDILKLKNISKEGIRVTLRFGYNDRKFDEFKDLLREKALVSNL